MILLEALNAKLERHCQGPQQTIINTTPHMNQDLMLPLCHVPLHCFCLASLQRCTVPGV